MLDPNKLIAMLTDMNSMAQSTQNSLTSNFMTGVSGMNLEGNTEMAKMMSMVAEMNEKASSEMSGVMNDFQNKMDIQQQASQAATGDTAAGNAAPMNFPQGAMDFFTSLQKK